ncbi:MAG: hypothetical protein DRP46_12420, partial [Candidatus Zixiibacteriota bacterium]
MAVSAFGAAVVNVEINEGADWEQKAVQLNIMHPKFGAKPDLTSYASANVTAIQKALDSLNARGGGCLFIPEGLFWINATVNIPGRIKIQGTGYGSAICATLGQDIAIFRNADTTTLDSGITIEGVRFYHYLNPADYDVSQALTHDAIELINCRDINITNCYFSNSPKDAIKLRRSYQFTISNNVFWDLGEEGISIGGTGAGHGTISGNIFIGQDSTFEGTGALEGMKGGGILCNASDVTISNNYFTGWGTGVDVNYEGSDSLYNVIVTGNEFERFTGAGVAFIGVHHSSITNNTFGRGTGYAIYIDRYQTSKNPDHITISNNIIDSLGDHTGLSREGIGIYCLYGSGHQIIGNKVSNNSGDGISTSNITNSAIIGNVCHLNDSIGIKMYDSDSCVVSGNIVWGDSIGISLANTSDYCQVSGNYSIDNQTSNYYQLPSTSGNFKYAVGEADSAYATLQFVRDSAGGTTNADSLLGFPIEGTITDNYLAKLQISGGDTTWQIEADQTGEGSGSEDSLTINAGGSEYTILNNLIKLKPSTGITFTREDSSTYDVIQVSSDLGTSIETGEITNGTIAEADLHESTNSPTDDDILTYNAGAGGDFSWASKTELGIPGDSTALLRSDRDDTTAYDLFTGSILSDANLTLNRDESNDDVVITFGRPAYDDGTITYGYNEGSLTFANMPGNIIIDQTDLILYDTGSVKAASNIWVGNTDAVDHYLYWSKLSGETTLKENLHYDWDNDRFEFSDHAYINGDLTIGGDDLFMGTNTDAYMLIADGTNYNPVSISGDITITNAGVVSLGADKIDSTNITDASVAWDDLSSQAKDSARAGSGGSGDTALVLSNEAGGADWVKIQGDTLMFKLSGVSDTFFVFHD